MGTVIVLHKVDKQGFPMIDAIHVRSQCSVKAIGRQSFGEKGKIMSRLSLKAVFISPGALHGQC